MQNYLTKRNIVIAGVVIILAIGALLYFGRKTGTNGESGGGGFFGLFPGGETQTPSGVTVPPPVQNKVEEPPPTPSAPELPLTQEVAKNLPIGSLLKLTDEAVTSIKPGAEKSALYHKNVPENLGHLFERKADGTNKENRLSNFTVPQIIKVVWAAGVGGSSNKAVVFYNLSGEIRKLLIDYGVDGESAHKTNFLPDSISDVAFSPDGKSMAFINDLNDTRNIFVATADFKNPRKILDNVVRDMEISWPAAGIVALKTKSSYLVTGYLYTVDVKTGALNKIADGLGLDAVWNSDGSGALYSSVNSGGAMNTLKFYEVKSQAVKNINIRTIAEKCAFLRTTKTIAYCGAPRSTQNAASSFKYPDDWWKGKVAFQDDFVVIDTAKEETTPFVTTTLDAVKPTPLLDDSWLFFKNKSSGALWSLKLKP